MFLGYCHVKALYLCYMTQEQYLEIIPGDLEVPKLHAFLLGSIGPRPICFASTVDASGNPNLSPFSFFNVFGANPPILIFSPARRVRDNTIKHTLENVLEVKEVVINVVNFEMVQQMSLSSTEYEKGVNEFLKSGLTMLDSDLVSPPRVKESPVQLECRVTEVIETGPDGGAGNLVVCHVLKMHINKDVLDEKGIIDPSKLDQVARMGGNWYSRARAGLFEVAKPIRNKGIGVDALPESIRNSEILTGNELGILGNVENLPGDQEVNDYRNSQGGLRELIRVYSSNPKLLQKLLHQKAAVLLRDSLVEEAWKVLKISEEITVDEQA